jgi:cyclopropane fatty-acyl-phospholipid synthase-like methyltransferase
MTESNIEYVGLIAEAWDALRGDTSTWEDRQFYLDLIRERGEPVLDVGCGTGRLLLDFLGLGIDIDGVDNSEPMLALCRRKAERLGLAPNVHLQSMSTLGLSRQYRTIIVPSSSFQLLLDRDEAGQALDAFHRHLEPAGTLAMPIIVMDKASEEAWTAEAPLEDGSTVRRTARAVFDPARRVESTDDLYEVFRDGELIRSERHLRDQATLAWTADELRDALEAHGFADLEFLSGFTREPRVPADEIFTVLARRP